MNCQQLHQDIATLTTQKEKLANKLAQMNETTSGKPELKELLAKTEELENNFLEKYLDNFAEKNPNLFAWQLGEQAEDLSRVGCINAISPLPGGGILLGTDDGLLYECAQDADHGWQIKNKVDGFGWRGRIHTITQLSDSAMLIGCTGSLHMCGKNEDNVWELWGRLDGFEDNNGTDAEVYAVAPLPDGGVLVGGREGTLRECRQDDYGFWQVGERIDGFKNRFGGDEDIKAIASLPDGKMLLGGMGGSIYEGHQDSTGQWVLEYQRRFASSNHLPGEVYAIAGLPDGGALIGGGGGTLCEYRQDKDGHWRFNSWLDGFEEANEDGDQENVTTITQLPDGGMLAGGDQGTLCEYQKQDGEWRLHRKLAELGWNQGIQALTPLPDGNVLVGGGYYTDSVLRELKKPPRTVETLRENLDKLGE